MSRAIIALGAVSLLGLTPLVARAQAADAEGKGGAHLFRPTPGALRRELSTDRPDTTESPHTVDAGHAQIEMDAFSLSRRTDEAAGVQITHTSLLPMNLKLGLTERVDVQLLVRPFEREQTRDLRSGAVMSRAGFGDLDLRTKINLWGNDAGATALALMPFVTFPTDQSGVGSGQTEGGLILPLGLSLPAGVDVGLMVQAALVRTPANDAYEAELLGSGTVSRAILGDLGAFAEVAAVAPPARVADLAVCANFGLLYQLGDDYQLDAGANVGLTEAADDLRVFAGVSGRPW